jgi:serine/threonine protein kinase
MLLDVVRGGELWSVIHREQDNGEWTSGLGEDHAKFYALALADTLAYIHKEKFIYRDLKPENCLIDTDGYPVLVDFGFSKYCPDKTYTLCGTPNYLAPEIIMNKGHGVGADHWDLGIVTYEMITGENPFYFEDMDQMTLFQSIVKEPFYPLAATTSPELNDFITGLLEKEPAQRLGMLAGRENDILRHNWFDGLNVEEMRQKKAKAPWVPKLKNGKQ